jgi:hypothetical protein
VTRPPRPPLRPHLATGGTGGDEPPMPAAGLTFHPQPCQFTDPPSTARVRALFLPADPRRPGQIIPVALSSSAISDVIGGGLLDEVDCTDTSMPMHVIYQDAHRDTKGLPHNDRAWRLAARLNWPHVHQRISLRGDALITGLGGMGQDTDVPNDVATAAYNLRILPDRRCSDTHHRH